MNPLALLGFIPNLFTYWQKQQELKLRWYELIVKVTCDLVRFIIAHIRVILIVLIVALGTIHYLSLRAKVNVAKSETIVAKKALIEHIEADSAEAKKREAENKLNKILAQKKTDADVAKHNAEINLILSKGKTNEIFNHHTISNLRSGLRHKIEGYQAAGLLENDANRTTKSDGNTALPRPISEIETELATCKEAGAIAAADFNFCKSYVETQQSILGVENE